MRMRSIESILTIARNFITKLIMHRSLSLISIEFKLMVSILTWAGSAIVTDLSKVSVPQT